MFVPDLLIDCDLTIPPKFLEQEPQAAKANKTNKVADILMQVKLKFGTKKWI